MITTCRECGFPVDTPQRAHDFIHQLLHAMIEYRGTIAQLDGQVTRLREAAGGLLADVRRRYPDEDLKCPYMQALDAAVKST